jgi:hypothetical protein
VVDFSLLRTRFVLTGVLTVTPLLLALIWGIYAAVDIDIFTRAGRISRRGLLFLLGDVAVPFVLYFALFAVVSENELAASAREAALLSVLCAVVVLILLGTLVAYRAADQRPLNRLFYRGHPVASERLARRFGVPDTVLETTIVAGAAALVLLGYIALFGQFVYPTIPEQIGGGRPRPAQLLFASGGIPAARELGIAVSADAPLSPPLELLWEGEDSLAIGLPGADGRAVVQIANSLVDGIVTGAVLSPTPAPP